MKRHDIADAAEQLLAATGWLPALLRTRKPDPERVGEKPNDQTGASYPAAAVSEMAPERESGSGAILRLPAARPTGVRPIVIVTVSRNVSDNVTQSPTSV
ncbi:hypothetical protein [Bradyrhizobium sp. SZCCHNR2032]|uniref:hypothetical protein n=1 Tax=Bradyrhizobium sp. SZCCHNR2032 TaxID=3057384 RepID=UPI0039674C57